MLTFMDDSRQTGLAIPNEKRAGTGRGRFTRRWIWLASALFVLMMLVLSHVKLHRGYVADDKRTATRLIERFHERLNAGQFNEIYEEHDQTLKSAMTREIAIQSLQEITNRFGTFKAVTDSETNVIVGPTVEARAAYNSTFAKDDATELFEFLRRGDELKLAIYQIYPGTKKLEWKNRFEAQP